MSERRECVFKGYLSNCQKGAEVQSISEKRFTLQENSLDAVICRAGIRIIQWATKIVFQRTFRIHILIDI